MTYDIFISALPTMTLVESNDELQFVRHAVDCMGNPPNLRPELTPGGEWISGYLTLTWGVRMATEPPTLRLGIDPAFNAVFLPRDLPGRVAVWKRALRASETPTFRERVLLTAICSWTNPDTL